MSEKNKPYLIISKECDEIQINIKRTKPYMKLQQENKQLKDKLKGVQEERDYLFNKQSIENKYLALENKQLKEIIKEIREYIKDTCYYYDLENYSSMTSNEVKELLQILDKVKENK